MERNNTPIYAPTSKLTLIIDASKIFRFFPLLEKGFIVKAEVGCSIKMFLCNNLDLTPDYVDGQIKTIFLDGKAVDDLDSAIIRDGSTLALSAAMPGLVGATLRRGGYLAPLRNEITHKREEGIASPSKGTISLKLFNAILKDLGQPFLLGGICVRCDDLINLCQRLSEDFWTSCKAFYLDNNQMDPDDFLGMKWIDRSDMVLLRIESGD